LLELAIVGALSFAVGLGWATAVRSVRQADPAREASRRVGAELSRRLDPETATGLALTLALGALIVTGIVLGVLIAMIRHSTGIVHVDLTVTRWAASHETDLSLGVLGRVTWAGSTIGVVLVATGASAYAVLRLRRWSVPLFLAAVVVGQFVLSNAIKLAVARVRPDAPPLHVVTGPSFPSGHATAAAATWAAAALVLGRSAGPRLRAALAGGAAAIAVAVACSRVLLGAHWMSDMLGGLTLGWTWFALCAVAFGGRVLRLGQPAEEATRVRLAVTAPEQGDGADARSGAA
jgi:membrane-associated phospholipid phosphatase